MGHISFSSLNCEGLSYLSFVIPTFCHYHLTCLVVNSYFLICLFTHHSEDIPNPVATDRAPNPADPLRRKVTSSGYLRTMVPKKKKHNPQDVSSFIAVKLRLRSRQSVLPPVVSSGCFPEALVQKAHQVNAIAGPQQATNCNSVSL